MGRQVSTERSLAVQLAAQLVEELDHVQGSLALRLTLARAELAALQELSGVVGDAREGDAAELDARAAIKQAELDGMLVAWRIITGEDEAGGE